MSTPHRLHLRARPKFRDLIDTLRTRVSLKEQISPAHLPIHSQQSLPQPPNDILPVTQLLRPQAVQASSRGFGEGDGSQEVIDLSEIEETLSETEQESTREAEGERMLVNEITDLLRPEQRMAAPKNEGRTGCIRRQRFTLNKPTIKQPKYTKIPRAQQLIPAESANVVLRTAIKEADEMEMIKFWNSTAKIDQNTSMESISDIFTHLIEALNLNIPNPTIKKYKNCIYMGTLQSASTYEGIIYYLDHKLYYGELVSGIKQGYGVEIDFNRGVRFNGYFEQGKKTGLFHVQKERQNYEGLILHGLYHGNGKLMTEDSIYTGSFENGKKHGFGEEFYPKTGLRLKGCFKNGEFQHLDKSKVLPDPTSEAQLVTKPEKVLAKSNSYDIDFQLQRTFKKQVQGLVRNQLDRHLSKDDSKSLFDIVANTSKTNKYDHNLEDVLNKLPKIRVEGVRTKFRDPDPEVEQGGLLPRRELQIPHRRYHSQQQKSFASSNGNADLEEPLSRHRLNTPIHRLK